MTDEQTPEKVSLRIEIELELSDVEALIHLAEEQILQADYYEDEDDRLDDLEWVRESGEAALTYLVDSEALVEGLPGVELVGSVVGPVDDEHDHDHDDDDFEELDDFDVDDDDELDDDDEDAEEDEDLDTIR